MGRALRHVLRFCCLFCLHRDAKGISSTEVTSLHIAFQDEMRILLPVSTSWSTAPYQLLYIFSSIQRIHEWRIAGFGFRLLPPPKFHEAPKSRVPVAIELYGIRAAGKPKVHRCSTLSPAATKIRVVDEMLQCVCVRQITVVLCLSPVMYDAANDAWDTSLG